MSQLYISTNAFSQIKPSPDSPAFLLLHIHLKIPSGKVKKKIWHILIPTIFSHLFSRVISSLL